MRNIGITLPEYYTSTFFFNFFYQIVLITLFLMFTKAISPVNPLTADSVTIVGFAISTALFLLSYASFCAIFSSLIQKYNHASDLIGLLTFLINFVPTLLFMTVARKNYGE